ncbi:Prepilin-type N-terminal cleavage/methylation domain-containing protein [Hyella patelloides LEGE 07179]|uniref:Prepilin-type N-terminal cleavage/methylation domain-containing protein n=1 Tax=Hyella patelloides LEGE 07179 TaxID=945734 RepID=A0A563VXW1_9CYAN|nr:type IV pilin-like G/H family protein [Hyella patelloides]VEP16282.1 Prepilin-type N-terminal cleavage/methylation domain-containing protein [Hyella patelloides LEGE 07179]
MNTQYVNFLLNRTKKRRLESGFTLIELLIVMIILGLLSAIALPNFIGQVGKARETEAKNSLGTLGRAQQAYHLEHQVFANNLNNLSNSNLFQSEYYSYPDADTATNSLLKQRAVAINSSSDRVRNYAVGVYFNSGAYQLALCEGTAVGVIVEVPDSFADSCTNDGTRLR